MGDEYEWVSPLKLREYYVDRAFADIGEAEKQLHLAVISGEVRARFKGLIYGPEWLKQIVKSKYHESDPYALPPDIELSVEDAKRKWNLK
jgi:hypothetical protein